MGRLLCIDYGRRRCGVAATDPLRIVASAVTTVDTPRLQQWVVDYVGANAVDAVVVGLPTTVRGQESDSMRYIRPAMQRLSKALPPDLPVIYWDERFTSVLAHRSMIDGGVHRMDRRDKAAVDRISATIILNDYLQSRAYAENPPAVRSAAATDTP